MATQSLRFGGINRNTNLCDSPVGDCEEMINVRSENGAIKIEKDRKIISSDIPYTRITTHEIGDATNFIGYDKTGIVWFDPATGDILGRLYTSDKDLDKVHICTMNNMVLISDSNTITNTTLLFKENKYSNFITPEGLSIPINIDHHITPYYASDNELLNIFFSNQFPLNQLNQGVEGNLQTLQAAVNKIFDEYPYLLMGYYLVGINFTLWDNTETGLQNLRAFYPIDAKQEKQYLIEDDLPLKETIENNYYLDLSGLVHTHWVSLSIPEAQKKAEYSRYIKSINVYMSRPILSMVFDEKNISIESKKYKPLFIKESELDKELMYKVKSFNLEDMINIPTTSDAIATVSLEPGLDKYLNNSTLDVDNGLVYRAGKIKAYNNRFHFYNTQAKINLSQGYYLDSMANINGIIYEADMYIFLRNNDVKDITLKYPNISLRSKTSIEPYDTTLDYMTIVQDSRAYKIVLTRDGQYAEIALQSSSRYNYAYAYLAQLEWKSDTKYDDIKINAIYQEADAINVTSQNNPVYFPVEHSYKFDGQVRDIAYATEPISQTQISQYPLYVFTDNGVYALEQGSGAVLYGNITFINTDKILSDKPTCLTRNGVAYIANGNVYILAGRNNLNISQSLKGKPDMDIRDSKSFQVCCQNDKLYNITQYLSDDSFEKFLDKAQLCYSPINDELYVCNVDYAYSYVFSFLHKNWHKRDGNYISINDNLFLAEKKTSTTSIRTATGKIYISDIITHPEHTFRAASRCLVDKDYISSSNGEWISLCINDQYVMSYNFTQATNLRVIIATLLQAELAADYDEYYDGRQHVIYSALPETEANLRIERASDGYTILDAFFEAYANSVLIPGKGIGATITISGTTERGDIIETFEDTTRAITEADTKTTIAEMITQFINDNHVMLNVTAVRNQTQIDLTARVNGAAGNNTSISCSCSDPYIGISVQDLSGGEDNYTETIYHNEIYDMSQEVNCVKTIHIQSRPISWPNVHTLINRLILNCKAQLGPEHNLSVYVFASNNLHTWGCVAASQKTDVIIDHIRLYRVARAWKHFIVIIGGKVYSNTELAAINLDIEHKINNKLR